MGSEQDRVPQTDEEIASMMASGFLARIEQPSAEDVRQSLIKKYDEENQLDKIFPLIIALVGDPHINAAVYADIKKHPCRVDMEKQYRDIDEAIIRENPLSIFR